MLVRPIALRYSPRDALFVILAGMHGVLLLTVPSAPLIALALWWNANTISHNFIHLPFFRSQRVNALFSMLLSALLGLPQTLWRDRHVAHHTDRVWRFRWSSPMLLDAAAALAVWTVVALAGPAFFFTTWLPGWMGGMILCQVQGHFEHAGGTVSHYGRLYNALFFNDGYHVEHHARPGLHWTALPQQLDTRGEVPVNTSRWPAVLRWLETSPLDTLEQLVLRSTLLQRWIVDRHSRAFSAVLDTVPADARVTVIGGGIFPRTALVLRHSLPGARITIVDRSARNIATARPLVDDRVHFIHADFSPAHAMDTDILVVPLAFNGNRSLFYAGNVAPVVIVHDWVWRRRGNASAIVSPLLLKRVNRVGA